MRLPTRLRRWRAAPAGFALSVLAVLPAAAQRDWRHAIVLHPPDLNVFYWLSDSDEFRNNPQSFRLAYQATLRESATFVVDAGPADPPPALRRLTRRYGGLDLGLGLMTGLDVTSGYWMGFGARLGYAWCPFAFDGYSLAPSGNYFVALGDGGRGSLRQIGVEGQWVHRWLPGGTPLFFEATVGGEVGGRGMFSAQALFPNGGREGELLEPNRYHGFVSARIRFGVGWRLFAGRDGGRGPG